MRHDGGLLWDRFFHAAVLMFLASTAYWYMFSLNAYNTFHDYSDLGEYAENFYYDANYPGAVHGLQLLIFGNHISLDQLLFVLLPYYLHQSATTLLFVQALVLCLTGLAIFVAARDMLDDGALGLLLCFAYLVNPGMHGMMVFDYHVEYFIIPFFVLSFYYMMKLDRWPYYLSLALLLGTVEVAPILAAVLGAGTLVYEHRAKGPKHVREARTRLAVETVAISLAVLVLYNIIFYVLIGSYGTYNAGVPTLFKVQPYPLVPMFSPPVNGGLSFSAAKIAADWQVAGLLAYGLIVGLAGLGLGSLFAPLELLVFSLPWLAEVFFGFGSGDFALVWYQYFSYVLGGAFAASVLGLKSVLSRKKPLLGLLPSTSASKAMIVTVSLLLVAFILAVYPFFVYNRNLTSVTQSFLFRIPAGQQELYSQLDSALARVPANASLMTQYFIMPHVANRLKLELLAPGMGTGVFIPQYILVDFNQNISTNVFANSGQQLGMFENYTKALPYGLIYENGTAELYEYSPPRSGINP